jgi:D-alanine-D-alanine ligase
VESLRDAAERMHAAIGVTGYSRSDFIVQPEGPVFLEINTLPGLTAASLFPRELAEAGIPVRNFLLSQLALARAHRVGD